MNGKDSLRQSGLAIAVCILLGAAFLGIGWSAVSTKSPTTDEVSHAVAGWFDLYKSDFRVSPDVPPLWEYWIALPMGKEGINRDSQHGDLWLVQRARMMSIFVAAGLAGLIGWWAWELAGPLAAIIAMFFYCLDPNMLGHGALAKNDLASALLFLAGAYAVWKVGRKLTWIWALVLAVAVAAGVAVKLSGLLLGPVVGLILMMRALAPRPWEILGRSVSGINRKLVAAACVCLLLPIITYFAMWACYHFRYQADPYEGRLQMSDYVRRLQTIQLRSRFHRNPTQAERDAWEMPPMAQAILYANQRRLIPQAMAAGLLFTESEDQGTRPAFLLGQNYNGGIWQYFPLVMMFKTPLATLAAILSAILIGVAADKRGAFVRWEHRWSAICLGIPPAIYGVIALTAKLNLGLRHVFPIYPFLFIVIGVAMAWWCTSPKRAVWLAALAIGLVAETALAYPNYIAFFNSAFASHRLFLLSDSNLDWGQDLPLLAAWQKQNPDKLLYVDYEGACDPSLFGIRYINLPGGRKGGPPAHWPTKPGVLAIGATVLQERIYPDSTWLARLGLTRDTQPLEVLGETIYLFRFDGSATP